MSGHTPGPWIAEPIGVMGEWGIHTENGRVDEIASCDENNARLIAAAPDLLEALIRVVDRASLSDLPDFVIAGCRAAIAKATGGAA